MIHTHPRRTLCVDDQETIDENDSGIIEKEGEKRMMKDVFLNDN